MFKLSFLDKVGLDATLKEVADYSERNWQNKNMLSLHQLLLQSPESISASPSKFHSIDLMAVTSTDTLPNLTDSGKLIRKTDTMKYARLCLWGFHRRALQWLGTTILTMDHEIVETKHEL